MDVPLDKLPQVYWGEFAARGLVRGETDVVLVTDALVKAPDSMVDGYKKWAAAEKVKTYGIVIDSDNPGDLPRFCDRCYTESALSLTSKSVADVLSI